MTETRNAIYSYRQALPRQENAWKPVTHLLLLNLYAWSHSQCSFLQVVYTFLVVAQLKQVNKTTVLWTIIKRRQMSWTFVVIRAGKTWQVYPVFHEMRYHRSIRLCFIFYMSRQNKQKMRSKLDADIKKLKTHTSSLLSEEIRTPKRTLWCTYSTLFDVHEDIHRGKTCSISETCFGDRTNKPHNPHVSVLECTIMTHLW